MTTFWAEHAWLPTGLATSVRLTIEGDRFAAVEAKIREGRQKCKSTRDG